MMKLQVDQCGLRLIRDSSMEHMEYGRERCFSGKGLMRTLHRHTNELGVFINMKAAGLIRQRLF